MLLAAWPKLSPPTQLELWLGAFGDELPPPPSFEVNGTPAQPLAPVVWRPIRDRVVGPGGGPRNHQAIVQLASTGPDRPHRIAVIAGAARVERVVRSLPAQIPARLDGTFNLLLSSCYFQPNDAGGLLGTIVDQLPVRPHMTLLAGDQVYVDLPLFEDLPEEEPGFSRAVGAKYRRNWTSRTVGRAGLEPLLTRAPTLCVPDDHEFWNNFPFEQKQLPGTWTPQKRSMWGTACQALYEDYQQGGVPGSAPAAWRLDVAPLAMLFLDTRCARTEGFGAAQGLMRSDAQAALDLWKHDLLAARGSAQPLFGLLSTGQALFIERPGDFAAKWKDAELANYAQFAAVESALAELADAGIPVVFLTGDVHWGRVSEALHVPSGRRLLHEVICSPSRLIDTPGSDQLSSVGGFFRGIFGRRPTWPRHDDPPDPPRRFGPARCFAPTKVFGRRGDQVAVVQFSRSGLGLEMQVTWHAIHDDPEVARPETVGPFVLTPA